MALSPRFHVAHCCIVVLGALTSMSPRRRRSWRSHRALMALPWRPWCSLRALADFRSRRERRESAVLVEWGYYCTLVCSRAFLFLSLFPGDPEPDALLSPRAGWLPTDYEDVKGVQAPNFGRASHLATSTVTSLRSTLAMVPAIFSVSLLFLLASAAAGPPTTSVPFVWPTKTTSLTLPTKSTSPTLPTKTTSPTLPCRDYLRFTCPHLNCPDAVPHNYDRCLCGYCPNGPLTTAPTTVQTPTQATAAPALKNMPTLRTTERTTTEPWPTTTRPVPVTTCFNCVDPPCVDKTAYNSFACSCGTCPTGPNCYAWDGSIIPAGEPVEVDGAMCECRWKTWGDRFSPYATCRWGVLSG
ncbi:hypothetical protein Bbelb_357780 [Branchiostoma belcheri]|nr:hypothetical protein Bbelb_357780 [Branchiostoma belcheri]